MHTLPDTSRDNILLAFGYRLDARMLQTVHASIVDIFYFLIKSILKSSFIYNVTVSPAQPLYLLVIHGG